MAYTINDIDKILGFSTWTNKEKSDELLRIDCSMYTCLGSDSTKQESEQVKKNSRAIYKAMKEIDPRTADLLTNAIDK